LLKLKSARNKRETVVIVVSLALAILILGFKDFFNELWYEQEKLVTFILRRHYILSSLIVGMNLFSIFRQK